MAKTWDEFIARQVEATLKGERQAWGLNSLGRTDLRWYRFGQHLMGPSEYWYVDETTKRVLDFRKYP